MADFFKAFLDHADSQLNGAKSLLVGVGYSQNLVSKAVVELPLSVHQLACEVVKTLYSVCDHPAYQETLKEHGAFPLKNLGLRRSIFNSFDFHFSSGQLKLIEINTNASGSTSAYLIHKFRNVQMPAGLESDYFSRVRRMVLDELKDQGSPSQNPRIAIVDEHPVQQKAYYEFLLFQRLFESWGWSTRILDISDSNLTREPLDLIYNRSTDFYLEGPFSVGLRQLYEENKSCVSPNPYRYYLMAEKSRFELFASTELHQRLGLTNAQSQIIQNVLPQTLRFLDQPLETLWADRKRYFFKPRRSYGARAVYKGASISKTTFLKLSPEDYLAQEVAEPGRVKVDSQEYKFDLRYYTHGADVILVTARLFQGQLMNFQTPGGGFAPVSVV